MNAIEIVTNLGETRRVKAPIDILKEHVLEYGFLLEHNDAFENTFKKLVDQGIVQLKHYLEEGYVAVINRSTRRPLVIPCQGLSSAKKPLVIPCGEPISTKIPVTIPVLPKGTMVIRDPSPIPY